VTYVIPSKDAIGSPPEVIEGKHKECGKESLYLPFSRSSSLDSSYHAQSEKMAGQSLEKHCSRVQGILSGSVNSLKYVHVTTCHTVKVL
jgi:hypothetical protein